MSSPTKQCPNGSPHLRRVKLALACVSIAANTLCAGGIICFPLIAPTLVTQLKLTQPQLTTFYAYSGMAGQYLFAAFAGKAIDYYGPWICSLASAVLFSTVIHRTADSPSISLSAPQVPYARGFLSAVVTASKNFPHYIGLATGTSAALFGLSPTFLSILATRYFSRPDTGLDVTQFLRFLALLSGFVHLVGAFTMHVQPPVEECLSKPFDTDTEDPAELADECTSLLPKTSSAASFDVTPATDEDLRSQSALDMLKDFNFWILAFIVFVILGSCEMVISNIGTIVLSLPSRYFPTTALDGIPSGDLATSTQVRSISIANTVSRFVVGPLADFVSPVPSHPQPSSRGTLRKHFVSRLVFLAFSSSVLVCTCLWTVVGIRSQAALWALSIGAGIAYGCAFTILPSLVSSIWGIHNLGRNYGILIYAPFLGTSVFSYLYAFVAVEHTPADGGVCMGVRCWHATFEVSGVAAALAFVATLWLWKTWRGKV
ncbi:MFS general substrate transporter [Pisolithus orientalis]|uniref:MFS general substrate transporter n=1 Tax=Pisolithus orientalis TaxID=936130 RepID=UPI002224AEB4|nr:MFS general substrate transporter [Pisolithus orientalis]KAI5988957.1 MFS general substrate transporter [Pisolithus orientalis]